MIKLDLQTAVKNHVLPSKNDFKTWLDQTFNVHAKHEKHFVSDPLEICIRLVDLQEIQKLNQTYRHKDKPTNILSFPYAIDQDPDEIPLLGDLVICPEVIEKESIEQAIDLKQHWTHIVVHGALHLLGYDHIKTQDRKKMEAMEKEILDNITLYTWT
jgi:probable rRNA maturation factor